MPYEHTEDPYRRASRIARHEAEKVLSQTDGNQVQALTRLILTYEVVVATQQVGPTQYSRHVR